MKQPFLIGALCVLLTTAACSQEQALNLTLLKTSIRTQNDSLLLQATPTQAFMPTVVFCPKTATKGCTLKIDVSSTFEYISTSQNVLVTVAVSDGSDLPAIDPDANIYFCPACGYADERTFQWMQRNVPAGTKATVTVQFSTEGNYYNGAAALDRAQTIQLFKN